jgi:4-carboxymuconolactone decarboxylase
VDADSERGLGGLDRTRSERSAEGYGLRARAQGPVVDQLTQVMASLDPALPELADDFIFGTVWGRDGLSFEERMLVAIAALGATGHTDQLRNYLWGWLHEGLDPRKIQEALVMMGVYGGFPTMLTALVCWREVKDAARRRGFDLGDL